MVTLASVRKALGPELGKARVIGTIPGRGYRFLTPVWTEDLVDEPASDDEPPPETHSPNNLPMPGDRLLGRENDIATLLSRLPEARLVTLWGAGGIGKTRLAIELAREAIEHYPDGIWFLELAPLSDPRFVAEAIGAMFGLAGPGGPPAYGMMTTFLRRKRLLLVLDNCEHLVEEIARLAEAVLTSCPTVTILATSRERLSIAGEHVYRVPPLTTPDSGYPISVDEALRFSAVRLFVERAGAAAGSFVLTAASAPVVAEICRRLDGLALAIELAVVGLELLTPVALLAHLDARFRLLTVGRRTAQPRQQTLRATIDWSYDLLSEPERALLRRLSVFAGSFTIPAAAAVALGEAGAEMEAIHLMLVLVGKSLVVPLPITAGERRFRLLESTRAYGLEKLAAVEKVECLRGLAGHLIRVYELGDRLWYTTPSEAWSATYEPDVENLRTALAWAFGPEGDAAFGVRLVSLTQTLWAEMQLLAERRRWLELAEARIDETTPPGTRA
ncbi:MAG TPA: AAA family ATPase, partial [Actinocrinis sp.]|nr:AAA family ATPase [Actinocrinis sp.]